MSMTSLTPSDRKKLTGHTASIAAGAVLLIMGIIVFFKRGEALGVISGLLANAAFIAGIITLVVRILQMTAEQKSIPELDFLIWFIVGLIFKTGLIQTLGMIAVLLIGAFIALFGIRSIIADVKEKRSGAGILIAALITAAGVIVMLRAGAIFNSGIGICISLIMVIWGIRMISDGAARLRYLYNFRGLE